MENPKLMKCKTCGEPMTKIRHGEDQIKGWQCVPCMMSFAPEERADNWAVWWLIVSDVQYTQDKVDSEGNPPKLPKGTRVVFCPDKDDTKEGTVRVQYLHYDGAESFFGNVVVQMDDGRLFKANCFQCREVGKPHMWANKSDE